MDKETLSHYGWIVILVLILAVLLAFATPFSVSAIAFVMVRIPIRTSSMDEPLLSSA